MIELARAGSLRVHLVNAEGGAVGADVEARLATGDNFVAYGLSDSNGEAAFRDLAAGKYELYAYRGAFPLAVAQAEIVADAESAMELEVDEGRTLIGRVVFAEERDADATGVVIAFSAKEISGVTQPWQEAKVDAEGSFAIHALPPGDYRVAYRRQAHDLSPTNVLAERAATVQVDSAETEVEVVVDAAKYATIVVHVVDESQQPLDMTYAILYLRVGTRPQDVLEAAVQLASKGVFSSRLRAPPGTYELSVHSLDSNVVVKLPATLVAGKDLEQTVVMKSEEQGSIDGLTTLFPADMIVDVSDKATLRGYFDFIQYVVGGSLALDASLVDSGILDREGVFPVRMPLVEHIALLFRHFHLAWEARGDTACIIKAAR